MVKTANEIYRDFVTNGVPSSGKNNPKKSEIRERDTWVENAINAGLSNGGLIYDTKANMTADLAHPANASAWVVADSTAANNGIYRKSGASGSGSWTRIADLPYSIVYAQNDDSGTANVVVATSSTPVSATAYSQLISVLFTKANTGPMTISINGETARPLVTNTGAAITSGYVSVGMSALVQLDSGGNYRLFSYGDASAIQAAAEAALAAIADLASDANASADRAESYAAMLSADKIKFSTVAAQIADTIMSYSPGAGLIEVGTGDVVEAQGFRYSVAASGASDHHLTTAGGVKLYVLPNGDRMYAAAFGIAGDGSDQTASLQKLFTAGSGYEIRLGRAQTYLSTEELVVGADTNLDLRGSTINFDCVGAKRNLAIVGNNARVHGGAVKNVEGTTGQEGTFQTPITIMRYPQLPGALNVAVEDMSVETVCPGGNGIAIFGDTSNVTIRNIRYPDSAYMGIPVMAHWSFNGDWSTVPPKTTVHQRNIVIENVNIGVMSYGADGPLPASNAVWLSAAYNVKITNMTIEDMQHGSAVAVYAGDWGFQYSQEPLDALFGDCGITIENVRGKVQTGLFVSMNNTLDPPIVLWPSTVTVRQMHVRGHSNQTIHGRGVRINGGHNVLVEDSSFDGFYYGVSPEATSTGFELRRTTVRNSYKDGYLNGSNTTPAKIKDCTFEDNNTSNSASVADINLQSTVGTEIDGNTFNSPLCNWNVRASNTVSRLRVRNNHSDAASSSVFSFGAGGDFGIVEEFHDNTASFTPTNGIRGGQTWVPIKSFIRQGAVNEVFHEYSGPGLPTIGTYKAGDRVICDNVGAAGAIVEGVCRAAGTPGTWNATKQAGPVGGTGSAPAFVGQIAIFSGTAYIATGTSATTDWKLIT